MRGMEVESGKIAVVGGEGRELEGGLSHEMRMDSEEMKGRQRVVLVTASADVGKPVLLQTTSRRDSERTARKGGS